jgi:hypothetical protein
MARVRSCPSFLRPDHIDSDMANPIYRFIISDTIPPKEAEKLVEFIEVM